MIIYETVSGLQSTQMEIDLRGFGGEASEMDVADIGLQTVQTSPIRPKGQPHWLAPAQPHVYKMSRLMIYLTREL